MNKSENINELATALSKAQGEMGSAFKSATNPFFKSTYATFEDIREASVPHLTKHGLSIVQITESVAKEISVVTILMHSSGQWIAGYYPVMALKPDPQSYKSALTYARRAAWESIVGVATSDDDAEIAMGRHVKEEEKNLHVKPNVLQKPEITNISEPKKPTVVKDLTDMAKVMEIEKAVSGTFTGSSFKEIFEKDKNQEFKWTNARYQDLKAGAKMPDWSKRYLTYVDMIGHRLE